MLREQTRNDALMSLIDGREVIAITRFDDGSISAEPLEEMLENMRYLVDLPDQGERGSEPEPEPAKMRGENSTAEPEAEDPSGAGQAAECEEHVETVEIVEPADVPDAICGQEGTGAEETETRDKGELDPPLG